MHSNFVDIDDEFARFEKEISVLQTEESAASAHPMPPSAPPIHLNSHPAPVYAASQAFMPHSLRHTTGAAGVASAMLQASSNHLLPPTRSQPSNPGPSVVQSKPVRYLTSDQVLESSTKKPPAATPAVATKRPAPTPVFASPPKATAIVTTAQQPVVPPHPAPPIPQVTAVKPLPAATFTTTSKPSTSTPADPAQKERNMVRKAAGIVWKDPSLGEWDPDDFRMFVGDLGNDVKDDHLVRVFSQYPSFQKAKVVFDGRSKKPKGFGFVSFKDPGDFARAVREWNGKYIGSRPVKLRKSTWQDRSLDAVKQKEKQRRKLGAIY